jgi:GNAT superfamily N-acetyltransferase
MLEFKKSDLKDVTLLTELKIRTFDDDSRRFFYRPNGGPPGYDSIEFQRDLIINHITYNILWDSNIIGSMTITDYGNLHYELSTIFIIPEYQNKGIGQQAIIFIEGKFRDAKKWTLDTPSVATRNHYLYGKMGYTKVNEILLDKKTNLFLYFYEKKVL